MTHRPSFLLALLPVALVALAPLAACGDDGGSTSSSGGGSSSSTSAGGNGQGPGTGTGTGTTSAGGGGVGGSGGGIGFDNEFDCSAPSGSLPTLGLEEIANGDDGLLAPALAIHAPGDAERLFILDLTGSIFVMQNGVVNDTPFLTVPVSSGGERGLLGLAFHPDYATNGRFFVHFSQPGTGDTEVAEFARTTADVANPTKVRTILTETQPQSNHNGGSIEFGADGLLYIFLGDGGGGGDPEGNGQDLDALLGKVLRIDVDTGTPYAIPSGNYPDAAEEVWAVGMRNPWRASFDGCTGDLYIGDVGQNKWEEIDVAPFGDPGRNWGWNTMEGAHCYPPNSACDQTGLSLPAFEYEHPTENDSRSVTGGYVYRGSAIPAARGRYFFADYSLGQVWSFVYAGGQATDVIEHTSELGSSGYDIVGFGQDAQGEVYMATVQPARLFRIVAQ